MQGIKVEDFEREKKGRNGERQKREEWKERGRKWGGRGRAGRWQMV